MKLFTAFISVTVLLLVGVMTPKFSFAQSSLDNTGTGTNYSAPSAGNGTSGSTSTNSTNTNDQNRGFDWRWLLPLLAIPVIYFATRRDTGNTRSEYRNQGLAGSKGGRTDRSRTLDEEEDDLNNNE